MIEFIKDKCARVIPPFPICIMVATVKKKGAHPLICVAVYSIAKLGGLKIKTYIGRVMLALTTYTGIL